MQKELTGIIPDLDIKSYHAHPAVSRSALMQFIVSPYHYQYAKNNPELKEATDDMVIGSMVHCLVLEPHKFDDEFFVMPELNLRTKDGKAERDSLMLEHKGKTVIKRELFDKASLIAGGVLSDADAMELFSDAKIEHSIFFEHEGVACKVRPDAWLGGIVSDLKTIRDRATPHACRNACASGGYFIQAGMISLAMKSIGQELEQFVLVFVEKTAPFSVAIHPLAQSAISNAEDIITALLRKLKGCMDNNDWQGYEIQEIDIPAWYLNELKGEQ